MDLIDERFDLYVTKDGTGCTISNEFLGTEFDCSAGRGSIVRSGSGEFFALWEAGWSFLVEKFRGTGVLKKSMRQQGLLE
ncbi:DUF6270 domain-containing protein [Candidatus Accumulibacter phosphatis]|uniref:DUF6270 domain-containing protein n=1 Tax=Candidatus Accumulibacter phosphatis TaxID=327160 RepID=UPI003C6BF418